MERLSRQLGTTAGDLEYGISGAEVARNDIDAQIAETKQQVQDAKNQYNNDVKPHLDNLVSSVTARRTCRCFRRVLPELEVDAAGALTGSAGAVSEKLGDAKSKLDSLRSTNSTNRPRSSMTCRRI